MNVRVLSSRFGFVGWLLLAGLVLWMVTAWPLPRVMDEAIPHTNLNPDTQTVRPITSGDHLQLLYHFWLGSDALAGHSPLFHNVYEFNLGDDTTRIQPDLYYMPFSLVYAAIAPLAGHAAGWNAAGLVSVLLSIVFLGLLARRFTDSWTAVALATLIAAAFPYRWITLFTGSPTGFAMAFPPMLAYGLDRAIRDRSIGGGILAGVALFCSYATDLHVFYFSALASPFFALLSLWMAESSPRHWPGIFRQIWFPLLPFVLLAAAAVGVSFLMSRHLADSVMAGGRTLAEIAAYSPPAAGLISTARAGMANHVYFGIPLFTLLGTALLFWAAPFIRHDSPDRAARTQRVAVLLLAGAVTAVVLLALGTYAPFHGLPIRVARKLVPKYDMIRQTVKIYCLLPALLVPLLALLLGGIFRPDRQHLRRASMILFSGLTVWIVLQSLQQTDPGFCRLPKENVAYTAVAEDDLVNDGQPAHALAIPLWPGDSHWTSLCEYAVMLSRVRLVNGYAPAVPAEYFENVFKKYESLNQGIATDEQLDDLLAMGVRHLLLHANAFPEQVSPFPAAATLRALIGHPRLALIADDGQIFAFRILPKHPVEHTPHANWTDTLYAAALHWNWAAALAISDRQTAPLPLRAPVFAAPNLRFLLRLTDGSSQPILTPPGRQGLSSLTQPIAGLPDWLQAELPSATGAVVSALSGPVTLKAALLTAGDLPGPDSDGVIRIPPALLFHAGHISPGDTAVTFDPETVPAGTVLYGPNLPFPPGVYDITAHYSAGNRKSPGSFRVLTFPGRTLLAKTVLQPEMNQALLPTLTLDADPIRFEFDYTGEGDFTLQEICLTPSTIQLAPLTAPP